MLNKLAFLLILAIVLACMLSGLYFAFWFFVNIFLPVFLLVCAVGSVALLVYGIKRLFKRG